MTKYKFTLILLACLVPMNVILTFFNPMGIVEWLTWVVPQYLLVATTWAHEAGLKTVSTTIKNYSIKHNYLAFLWGCWSGHFFWPGFSGFHWHKWWVLVGFALLIEVMQRKISNWPNHPVKWLLLGIPAGAYFWGSRF